MSRAKIKVSKKDFIKALKAVETHGPLKNRSVLLKKIAEILDISPSVALLRLAEFKINPKTPKIKRGSGLKRGIKIVRVSRADKLKSKHAKIVLKIWENSLPTSYRIKEKGKSLIRNVRKGSMSAIVKAKCLDCCAGEEQEIKMCNIKSCPLYLYRPFKN